MALGMQMRDDEDDEYAQSNERAMQAQRSAMQPMQAQATQPQARPAGQPLGAPQPQARPAPQQAPGAYGQAQQPNTDMMRAQAAPAARPAQAQAMPQRPAQAPAYGQSQAPRAAMAQQAMQRAPMRGAPAPRPQGQQLGAGAPAAGGQQMGPAIAVIAQAMARKQQEQEARKLAQAQLGMNHAKSLGFPTQEAQAGMFNRRLEDQEGPDYLSAILPMLQQRRGG